MEMTIPNISLSLSLCLIYLNASESISIVILRYQCRVFCVIHSIIVKEKIITIMMLIITGQDNLAVLLLL